MTLSKVSNSVPRLDIDPSLVHRLFYPQVTAVLSAGFGERVSAMPVVSYASVSSKPPILAVSCNPAAFTYKLVLKAGKFSLSLLDKKNLRAVELLASASGKVVKDKLKEAGLAHSRGTKLDVPVIDAAEGTLECTLRSKERVGDHALIFGSVKACRASHAFSDFWDFTRYRPILYTGWRDGMTTYPGA